MSDDVPQVAALEVGKPWPGDPATVAVESFGWHPHDSLALLVADNLSEEEQAGLHGPLDVAVVADGPIIGLLLRLQGWGWQEGLTWQREHTLPGWVDDPDAGDRLTITFVAVSAGIVEVVRWFSLSPYVTKTLRGEMRHRWAEPTDDHAAMSTINAWYARHGRKGFQTAIARCHAGD